MYYTEFCYLVLSIYIRYSSVTLHYITLHYITLHYITLELFRVA